LHGATIDADNGRKQIRWNNSRVIVEESGEATGRLAPHR
jgi:hypothetical protein